MSAAPNLVAPAGVLRGTRVVLARRVVRAPSHEDFRIEPFDVPQLRDGEVLVRNFLISADPGSRSILSGDSSYTQALEIGNVMEGFAMGEVVSSLNPRFAAGDVVTLGAGWQTHAVVGGRGYLSKIEERRLPWSYWIGVLGVPGMTAYFGLRRVAQLAEGETVVISSAAGPVGATAGQLARLWGAGRVVGIAGGPAKCAWLREVVGFDEVIDRHERPDLAAALAEACPKGIDVLFDNVGAAMIDAALPLMKVRGRIVASGAVGDYNVPQRERARVANTDLFISRRLRMEGLVVFDDLRSFKAAQAEVADLILSGRLLVAEMIADGIERLPEMFCGLFEGEGFGRRLVRIGAEPAHA